MNNKQKNFKILFLIFVFFVAAFPLNLKAQEVSTYYVFPSDVMEVRGLSIDTTGNFYFYNYDQNWNGNFSKLSGDGTISAIASGQNYHPERIAVDNSGNIYFTDMGGMEGGIKKITPEGIITNFFSNNSYIWNFTIDALDNLYFIDESTWPPGINKVTPEGTVSSYFADPNSYPQSLVFDKAGNLYFTDQYNWPVQIKKVTPEGSISSIISGNFYIENLVADSAGNIYFIDQNNWPNDIKKISPDGTLTVFVNSGSQNNPRNLTIDKFGNLYFTDYLDNQYIIRTIRNPLAPCPTLPPPVTYHTATCYGTSILLSAGGFGEIRWYDAPSGGNLLNTGNRFTTSALTTNTTFYLESYFCNSSSVRSALNVTVYPPPTVTITGSATGIDSVVLTASGGIAYLWSGGISTTTAQNTFTLSGNYSVTVTNAGGCTTIVNTVVTVNIAGLDKYGSILSGRVSNINDNGTIGAKTKVDRFGKIRNNGYDGLTAASAAPSAYEIKQNFPASTDGYYWIKNPNINGGAAFKIYADMTTDGGGWTLIMCNKNPNSGWTNANAVLRNQTTPTNDGKYSIIAWADYIKKSSTGFQYMMDANTRGNYGGIWTVNQPYSFVSKSNTNTDITLNTKFGNWNYFEGGGFGPRMPWWTTQTNEGIITTSQSGTSYWWGTLVTGSGWSPSPWLSGDQGTLAMQNPGIIWYWVR